MPILVACDQLAPGMMLAEPVVTDGRIMLQSGRPLTGEDIVALQRRYPDMTVRIGDPLLDGNFEFEDDGAERRIATEARQRITRTMAVVRERFKKQAPIGSAVCEHIGRVVHTIVEHLATYPKTAALITQNLNPQSYLGAHTSNVFYLSMLLGWSVRAYVAAERRRQTRASVLRQSVAMDLSPLGIGAFFMDVALLRAPALFAQQEPLSHEDRCLLENHPDEGAEMLPDDLAPAAKMIVRTHHETADGSGYPIGVPADKQHVFTRIVRIADAFDAATSRGVFKQARSPVRVLREMLVGPDRHCYDKSLMKAFVRLVQPFPIGTKVQLEDGRVGLVTHYNRTNPFRPILVVSFDADGRPLPRKQIEGPVTAGEKPNLRLRAYEGEDLSFLYEPPPDSPADHSPARRPFTTLLDAFYP